MKTQSIRYGLFAVVWMLSAHSALCQVSSSSKPTSTNIEELVLGDGYAIASQRRGIGEPRPYEGTLVKVTDHWLVLHRVSECRTERGVPVLSQVPYVNRLFRNVGFGRSDEYLRIPREAATIRGRVLAADRAASNEAANPAEIEGDAPPRSRDCMVNVVEKSNGRDELGLQHGHLRAIDIKKVTIQQDQVKEVIAPAKGVARIPYIGSAFRTTRLEIQKVDTDFSMQDVVCIRIPVDTLVAANSQ